MDKELIGSVPQSVLAAKEGRIKNSFGSAPRSPQVEREYTRVPYGRSLELELDSSIIISR